MNQKSTMMIITISLSKLTSQDIWSFIFQKNRQKRAAIHPCMHRQENVRKIVNNKKSHIESIKNPVKKCILGQFYFYLYENCVFLFVTKATEMKTVSDLTHFLNLSLRNVSLMCEITFTPGNYLERKRSFYNITHKLQKLFISDRPVSVICRQKANSLTLVIPMYSKEY